jgi:hypothetical protein
MQVLRRCGGVSGARAGVRHGGVVIPAVRVLGRAQPSPHSH